VQSNSVSFPRNAALAALIGLALVAAVAPAEAQTKKPQTKAQSYNEPALCPDNMTAYRGTGEVVTCQCDTSAMTGTVWGTDTYTDDSSVCAAALHAGAVSDVGGLLTVIAFEGLDSYQGSTQNGISSQDYGSWSGSFYFEMYAEVAEACPYNMTDLRGTSDLRTCQCAPDTMSGSVWGSGPYTDDSSICAAALHAGVIGTEGGTVTAVASRGQSAYQGTERNGIISSDYGSWQGSFYFP
jgi:LCCL domain